MNENLSTTNGQQRLGDTVTVDFLSNTVTVDRDTPETIYLAEVYFSPDPFSSAFNWRSVALTLDAWNRLSNDHYAHLLHLEQPDNPDSQEFLISYREINLWLSQGCRDGVNWQKEHKALSGDPESPCTTTTIELPSDPVELLEVLNMPADPLADDVIQLWTDLTKFLPTLEQ
jgi:hypothetical protein